MQKYGVNGRRNEYVRVARRSQKSTQVRQREIRKLPYVLDCVGISLEGILPFCHIFAWEYIKQELILPRFRDLPRRDGWMASF